MVCSMEVLFTGYCISKRNKKRGVGAVSGHASCFSRGAEGGIIMADSDFRF